MSKILEKILKDLGFGFGGNYVDKQYKFEDEGFYAPSYMIYNATVFYDQPRWKLGVKFNNISNKEYWDSYGMAQTLSNILVNLTLKF